MLCVGSGCHWQGELESVCSSNFKTIYWWQSLAISLFLKKTKPMAFWWKRQLRLLVTDYLLRFSLKSKDLPSTLNLYVNVLVMEAKGQDKNMICLQYDNDCFPAGVLTALIFDHHALPLQKRFGDERLLWSSSDCNQDQYRWNLWVDDPNIGLYNLHVADPDVWQEGDGSHWPKYVQNSHCYS